jgi:DNA (cytosine-5)-methyltransferase 1
MPQLAPRFPQPNSGVAVELCSGLGGIGLGLRALGFQVAKAYDSWDEAVAIYNHNSPDQAAISCNLLSKGGREIIKKDCRALGEIELLAAGPPCKGFSRLQNGYHDGRNGNNRVLAAMPDYVALARPRLFLIENVPDLIRHRSGKTLSGLVTRLARPHRGLRYRVEFRVYDAAQFGTPQARRRILIFGVRHDSGEERLPDAGPDLGPLFSAIRHNTRLPKNLDSYLDALNNPNDGTLTSASQALSDLPVLDGGVPEQSRKYATSAKGSFQRWVRLGASSELQDTRTPGVKAATLDRLRHIPAGGCARAIPKEHLNGLSRRYDSAYRRLHPDAPSTALSTRYDCVYHYSQERSLSVREYARLQGIPDRILFPATLSSRRSSYEMIGNSVPPLLIEGVLGAALGIGSTSPNK